MLSPPPGGSLGAGHWHRPSATKSHCGTRSGTPRQHTVGVRGVCAWTCLWWVGGGVGGGVQADEKGGTGERRGESCRLAIGVQRVHRRNRIRWQERRGDEGRGRVTDPSRSGGGSDGDGTGGGSRRAPGWRRRGCGRPARPQHFEISLTELQNPPKLARDSWNDLQLHCGGFSICFSSPTRMTLLKTLRRLLFRSSAHWVLQRSLGTVQNCC